MNERPYCLVISAYQDGDHAVIRLASGSAADPWRISGWLRQVVFVERVLYISERAEISGSVGHVEGQLGDDHTTGHRRDVHTSQKERVPSSTARSVDLNDFQQRIGEAPSPAPKT